MRGSPVHVVAGAVTDADGRVLLAQRPAGKVMAGAWEFPGGKLDAGEGRVEGLARELLEEIGLEIREPRPLIRVRHTYSFGDVLIDAFVVSRWSGAPRGLDGQALRWCRWDELGGANLLPADGPIVRALRLPDRLPRVLPDHLAVRDAAATVAVRGTAEICGAGAGVAGAARDEGVDRVLAGVRCATAAEALAIAGGAPTAGPDFIVMRRVMPDAELAALCTDCRLPVYACELSLEQAWALGATGVADA